MEYFAKLTNILTIVGIIVGFRVFIGRIMTRLYNRATRLVKTRSGGKKVIVDGA